MTLVEEQLDSPATLIGLCHYRWGIPILAELQRSMGGLKFVALQNRLGLSRDALSRTLDGLRDLDLVLRNPGYGHPMRPEHLLSPAGEDAGPASLALWDAITEQRQEDAAGRKWSLPTLWALGEGEERFASIQRRLGSVTPRALTTALRDLEDAGLAQREVTQERPPGVRYTCALAGERLAEFTDDLARALEFGR